MYDFSSKDIHTNFGYLQRIRLS